MDGVSIVRVDKYGCMHGDGHIGDFGLNKIITYLQQ